MKNLHGEIVRAKLSWRKKIRGKLAEGEISKAKRNQSEILNDRNMVGISPFRMSLEPFKSPRKGLLNGAKFIQNGSVSIKLRLLVIPSVIGPHVGHRRIG